MEYPEEFSKETRARIEAIKIRAGIDLADQRDLTVYGFPTAGQMTTFIMAVVGAFGHEACMLGLPRILPIGQDLWTVDRIERETIAFLDDFAIEAYLAKGDLKSVVTMHGKIQKSIRDGFLLSQEWRDFEEKRLVIAEQQASPLVYDPYPPLITVGPVPKSDTAIEIGRLRAECRITLDELAEETGFNQSTVYRHESGETTPQPWRISKYEKVFSKILKRDIVISVTPIRRK